MRNFWGIVLLLQTYVVVGFCTVAAYDEKGLSQGKKIIEYGWDIPTAGFVQQNIREMETRPFDGVVFKINEVPHLAFDIRPWTEDELQMDVLAQIEWDRFTDNFLIIHSANQYDMDWFNDAHWQTIVANMRLYARAARTAGCVGLVFDPEPYGLNPWAYSDQIYPDKSFVEVEAQVRQRGGQWLSAIQEEFPQPRILGFYLLSIIRTQTGDDLSNLPDIEYALLRAFLEGMLDVVSPATRLIEGNEYAYYYDETNKYFDDYARLRDIPAGFISPGNEAAFSERVEIGMALYMDNVLVQPFLGTETFPDEYKQAWWEHNVYYALMTADEYVWCYSEKMDWWANDVFPGGETGLVSAREKYFQGLPLGYDLYKTSGDYWNYNVPGTVISSPVVSIVGPAYGAILTTPATVTIQATAVGRNVQKIEFYMNSQKHGESNGNSGSYTWPGLQPGSYTFLARGFEADGKHGTSGSLGLTVASTTCRHAILYASNQRTSQNNSIKCPIRHSY